MYGFLKNSGRKGDGYGWLNPYFMRTGSGQYSFISWEEIDLAAKELWKLVEEREDGRGPL